MLRQTLGGRTYEINPAGVGDKSNVLRQLVLGTGTVLLSPALAVATAFMWLSPVALQRKIKGQLLPFICSKLNVMFRKERQQLLKECQGTVMDVGSGGGEYMKYFSKAKSVTALEPVESLHETIRKEAACHNVTTLTVLAVDVETYIRDHPGVVFDWIILGNVLCEVDDVRSTLDAVDKLLKPGTGVVYFSEHIACKKGSWVRILQDMLNPPWRTLSGGCNMNRDSLQLLIKCNPHWDVISWYFTNVKVGLGPFVMGLAQKREEASAV